jgi:hypothetical protein
MKKNITAESDSARSNLRDAIKNAPKKVSLKHLSLALGKNQAYLHQYLFRHSPKTLPEDIRLRLAQLLSMNEYLLRADQDDLSLESRNIAITYLDHPSQAEMKDTPWFIPQNFFAPYGKESYEHIRLAVVGVGHFAPQFKSGDVVMLNLTDKNALNAGFFALDMGDHIRIRHLEQISPSNPNIIITGYDDTSYEDVFDLDLIIGRVIFHAQILQTLT